MSDKRLAIYNASAGSGKTFQIAKNFLAKIIQNPENYYVSKLIGLTFTNEAAREMKYRILDKLIKATFNDYSGEMQIVIDESREIIEKQLKKKLTNEEYLKEINKRVNKRLIEILHQYDDFNLLTIDRFFTRLVKTFAREMDIPYDANIILNYDEVIDDLIDEIISETDENDDLMKNFIDLAVENAENEKSWDIKYTLIKIVQIIFDDNFKTQIDYIKTKSPNDFLRLKKNLINQKHKVRNKYLEFYKEGKSIIKSYEEVLNITTFINSLGTISKHKGIEFNKTHKKYIETQSDYFYYVKTRIKKLPQAEQEYLKNELNEEIHKFLLKVYDYYVENHQKYLLATALLDEINSLIILQTLINKIEHFKETTHSIFLHDFAHLIKKQIFENPDSDTPYIYLRLGEKFIHYFLDEFQDTSVLQWSNMIPLIKEALSKDFSKNISIENPGDAMIVGDAKQSIYRFRNGKPELFIDLSNPDLQNEYGNPFEQITGKKVENLEYNWRSDGQIIDFNNKFFSFNKHWLHNKSYQRVYDYVNQKVPKINSEKQNKGYVNINILDTIGGDENEVPGKVLEIINNVTNRGYKYDDICFLFGSHDASTPVAELLNKEGIPVISSRSLLLKKSEKVNFLINIMKYLSMETSLNLFDALQFLFNYHYPDNNQEWLKIFKEKSQNKIFKKLYDYGFMIDSELLSQLNLYDTVVYLIDKFKLNIGDDEESYLQSFLDDIHQYAIENKGGITGYLKHWKENSEQLNLKSADTKGSVRFMSIHASKGLEFPVVILLATQKLLGSLDKKSLVWIDIEPEKFEGFKTLPIRLSALENIEKYQLDYINGIEEKKFDNYNKLYVAHTRAKNELFILTQKPSAKLGKEIPFKQLYGDFLKDAGKTNGNIEVGDVYVFGEQTNKIYDKDGEKPKDKTNFQLKYWAENKDSKLKVKTKSYEYWNESTKSAVSYGMQIHEILSNINTIESWKSGKNKFLSKINEEERKNIENIIEKVLSHPKLSHYFSDKYNVLNERAILVPDKSKSFSLRRPDRILINKNEAVVIDYKTGDKHSKHKQQITQYAQLLEQAGFYITEKLLIYINSGNVEVLEVD